MLQSTVALKGSKLDAYEAWRAVAAPLGVAPSAPSRGPAARGVDSQPATQAPRKIDVRVCFIADIGHGLSRRAGALSLRVGDAERGAAREIG